jgi:hypothetical protein
LECSGEQPIEDSSWVNWKFSDPVPFGERGAHFAWQAPNMSRPAFCDKLSGKNLEFLESPNHPCTFTKPHWSEPVLPAPP